jgi:hypothetical protein
MGNNTDVRDTVEAEYGPPPVEMARALAEAREALRGYEASALAEVAATLAKAAESLARTARELREMSQEEWMDAERAAAYLKRTPQRRLGTSSRPGRSPSTISRSAVSSSAAKNSTSGS